MKNEDLLLLIVTTMPSYEAMDDKDKEIFKKISKLLTNTLLENYSNDLSDTGLAYIEVLNIISRITELEELEITTTNLLNLRNKTEVLSINAEAFSNLESMEQVEMLIPYMLRAGINPISGYDNINNALLDAVMIDD